MKLILGLLSTTCVLSGAICGRGPTLELRALKSTQIVGEPYDLKLSLVNTSEKAILVFDPRFVIDRLQIVADGVAKECRPVSIATPGVPESTWARVEPGAEHALPLGMFECLCNQAADTACLEWFQRPGNYRIEIDASYRATQAGDVGSTGAPAGAFSGSLGKGVATVHVLEPTGADAIALAWAREHKLDPRSIEVINRFPESRYAALVIYDHVALGATSAAETKRLLAQKKLPRWSSLPDPEAPDGWRGMDGPELARWQIAWADRVLARQPDFPYLDGVRVVAATSRLALGKSEEAHRILTELAKRADSREGQWASEFLASP
jgi:hypothetical protein